MSRSENDPVVAFPVEVTKPRVRALVVDDEPLARERIRRLLENEENVDIVAECGDGRQALEAIVSQRPDLLFLDVQMPEMDGFALLRAIGAEAMPVTIFTTAHDQYAVQAFEVHALDYLLKPIDPERFHAAFERARTILVLQEAIEFRQKLARLAASVDHVLPAQNRIIVKSGTRTLFIRPDEVDWIESAGNYVRIHHRGGSHLLRETMTGIESRLPAGSFARIQRTVIVNLDRVTEVRHRGRDHHVVVLQDGKELPLGKMFRSNIEQALGRF